MKENEKQTIKKISKSFAKGFDWPINGSGWLTVDPLSAYLCACGFENELKQIPENDKHPLVLVMTFKDGSQFIPAGKDLRLINPQFKNWMWI